MASMSGKALLERSLVSTPNGPELPAFWVAGPAGRLAGRLAGRPVVGISPIHAHASGPTDALALSSSEANVLDVTALDEEKPIGSPDATGAAVTGAAFELDDDPPVTKIPLDGNSKWSNTFFP